MLTASKKFYVGSRHQAEISQLGSLGEGLAWVEGACLLIPKSFPGDTVEVVIEKKIKSRYRARVLRWLSRAEAHQNVACAHFYECGGCHLQALKPAEQLEWKRGVVSHWIERSPIAPFFSPKHLFWLSHSQSYHYRHRVSIEADNSSLHFRKPYSNEKVPLRECPILVEGFFEALQAQARKQTSFENQNFSYLDGALVEGEARYEAQGFQFKMNAECFTQGNLTANEQMLKFVCQQVEDLQKRELLIDYYAGIGNFSLPLSTHFKRSIAVEQNPRACHYGQINAPHVEWITASTDQSLHLLEEKPSLVLLDPPRGGALALCRALAKNPSPRVIYISCSVATLIRDLTPLVKSGQYRIAHWALVDLFPQTRHIESIVVLDRIQSA